METSNTITKISAALIKAQMSMGNASKDNVNPFFKSKYADLNSVREACIPALNINGISALQPMVHIAGKNFINTILLHESGEWLSSLTEIIYSKQNDAQAQGSGITYARRYGLQSFVNIGSEDDDGNKASQSPKELVISLEYAENNLKDSLTIEELAMRFKELSPDLQSKTVKIKDEMKIKLTPKK
jgi:hypothetical protein